MSEEIRHGDEVPEDWANEIQRLNKCNNLLKGTLHDFMDWYKDQIDVERTPNDKLWNEIYDFFGLSPIEATRWYAAKDREGVWRFYQRDESNPKRKG